jgi:hypothetical protein
VTKRIVFRRGTVFTSYSNDPREYLGQFLVRDGLISEEQLFRALLRQEKEGQVLGAILMGEGLLTEEDLRRVLCAKAEETIYELFLWPEGQFAFKDGELPPKVAVHIQSEVTSIIMEGVRRMDEWARIRAVFPTMATSFKSTGRAPAFVDPAQARIHALAAEGRTLSEIALETHRTEFDTAALVYELFTRGSLAVDRVEDDPGGTDPVGAIQDLLKVAARRLGEKRFDAALAAYEQVLQYDRLNQNAKKGLIEVAEAREKERALRTVSLDKVPFLTVELRALTRQNFDPHEGFVLSRINGDWDVRSILKLIPLPEEDALLIFARLLQRRVVELR